MADAASGLIGWERALMAAEKVKERLRRATKALDDASVPYAVAGGNAVAEWVGRVDEEAVRSTRDVDLLVRRGGFSPGRGPPEGSGFIFHKPPYVKGVIYWPRGPPRAGGHNLFSRGEGRG